MKLKWVLRQIIPTKFATAYRVTQTNDPKFATWWMWLGRSFNVHHTTI